MKRPDPMIPSLPGAQDVAAMSNRQQWIDALYAFDGRDNPEHEMHGLYSGLQLKYGNLQKTD